MKTFKLFNFNRRTAMVQAEGCTAARQKIGVNPTETPTFARFASSLCLILTMLLTIGVGQMWAYWYVPGTINGTRWGTTDNNMGGDNTITFYAVAAGSYSFQLTNGSNWGGNGCIESISGATKGTDGSNATITTTAVKDITITVVDETNWKVSVTASDPTYHIKYQFGGSWGIKTLINNGDGTYSCNGNYSGSSTSGFNYIKVSSEGDDFMNWTTSGITLENSPSSTSDKCIFTFKPSDNTLKIRKCNTVTKTNYIYFYNRHSWSDSYIYFVIGHPEYSATYRVTNIANTKLYYVANSSDNWTDAGYYGMIGAGSSFGGGSWGQSNMTAANHYTAAYTTARNLANGKSILVTPNSTNSNGLAMTISSDMSSYTELNYSQTVQKRTCTGANDPSAVANFTQTEVNSGTVTISAYKMTGNGTASNTSNSATLDEASETSASVDAAYSGKVTYTASANTGYTFVGWATTAVGSIASTDATYNRYPTSSGTVYARFKENQYTAYVQTYTHGSSPSPSSATTMGQVSGGSVSVTPNTGYRFVNWTLNSGSGSFADASSASTTFYPTSNSQLCANIVAKTYTITLDDNGDYEGNGSATATYNSNTLSIASHATREDYRIDGYQTSGGTKVINADGSLVASVSGYTDGSSNWIKDDNVTLYAIWVYDVTNYTVTYGAGTDYTSYGSVSAYDNTASAAAGDSPTSVRSGHSVTFTATPETGYEIEGWYTDAACSSGKHDAGNSTYTVVSVTGDLNVYVKFVEKTWSVAFAAGTGGSVTTPNSTPRTVGQVTGISIAATPSSGYTFNTWTITSGSGSFTSVATTNSNTFKPTANTTVTATFTEISRTITIVNGVVYGGSATSTTAGVATTAKITANAPAAGKKFTGWTLGSGASLADGSALTDRTIEVNATADATVTANYADRAGVKMYFAKPTTSGWSNVKAYAWKSSDESVRNAAYPGVAVSTTEVVKNIVYYVYQYYTEADGIGGSATGNSAWNKIIFCNGESGGSEQKTANLTISDGHYYYKGSSKDGTGEATAIEHAWYLKGSMNSWGTTNPITHDRSTNTGTVTINLVKDTQYEFKICDVLNNNEMWTNNTALKDIKNSVDATTLYPFASDPYSMYITPDKTGAYVFTITKTNTTAPEIAIQYPSQYLVGSWDSWDEDDHPFDANGYVRVNLTSANTEYQFQVKYNGTWYGASGAGKITSTIKDWDFYASSGDSYNVTIKTGAAGYYVFGWNGKDKKISVIYPADTTKAQLTTGTYVYFDARELTAAGWWKDKFSTRFWLKNYASGVDITHVDCDIVDTIENKVFYALVPTEGQVGQVHLNRMKPDFSELWNEANKVHAVDRANTNQNCLKEETGKEGYFTGWTPQWTTYCPPMSSVTLADNGTTTWGGDGSSGTPYLVPTSGDIKVHVTASASALNDANMTKYFLFKKAGVAQGSGSSSTEKTITASSVTGTKEAVIVEAYNYYNSTEGTHLASSAIYYEARTPYSVTHTLVGATASAGATGAGATVYGAVYNATFAASTGYDLPTSVTVTIGGSPATLTTDYTWNSSTGALQIKANKITGNVVITVHGVAKALTFTGETTSWSTASNWSPACVPTIEHDVTINKPAVVDIEHAAAKSIVINQYSSNTGKLTIQANKGLEVEGTIRVQNAKNETVVTTPKDLILQSSSDGNATLIFANTALDDRKDSATVYMYSKAEIPGSGHWKWQYIGLPFESANATYTYYGSYIWKFTGGMWETVANGATLEPWQGYSITNSSATTYEMEGELVSTTEDKVFAFGDGDGQLLANSWTAPINIESFTTEGEGATFASKPATIYLFNTGSTDDYGKEALSGTEAGKYIAVPVETASEVGCPYIAPMQGFWISTSPSDGAGNVTLKYNKLVRPASERAIVAGAMRAPKREQTERPQVMKIFATGAKYSDRVTILSREDFSRGFDNGWDGEKISFGEEAPSIYVINGQDSYDEVSSIPEYEGTVIGFRSGTNNMATISFDYDGEETLYLNDLRDQISALISNENTYEFSTSANDDEARFIISATPIMFTPTAVENNTTTNENKVQKIIFNDRVYIIRNGRMYDATGVLCK